MARKSGAEMATDLRRLADYVEANAATFEAAWVVEADLRVHLSGDDAGAELAAFAALPGRWTKHGYSDTFWIKTSPSPGVALTVMTDRALVCERVVTTETVTDFVAPEGVELIPVERVVENVEWQCPESLLRLAATA